MRKGAIGDSIAFFFIFGLVAVLLLPAGLNAFADLMFWIAGTDGGPPR